MDDFYYERNQMPFVPLPSPFPPTLPPRPVTPMRPAGFVAQPVHLAPMHPAFVAMPPPPAPMPMPYPPPPMPGAPPPWMGAWGGPCGGGILGGLFGNRRALPIIIDQVLKGWAAFSGKPDLPTGDQLNQVSNVFSYLDTAAQYVKRDEQIRFFGGLARDIL